MIRFLTLLILLTFTHCTIVPVIPVAIEAVVKKVEEQQEDQQEEQQEEQDEPKKIITSIKLIEKPYEMNGKWFYPQEYSFFEEVGIAKTIDDLKTGERTKNGEIYHDGVMMSAHRSLPLPSVIRVTNLSNGYSVRVRVNHRGAYSNTNIINLSSEVFNKLKLNKSGDLVKINLIHQNETFIVNEAYTYDEEKKVVEAPLSSVTIETIDSNIEGDVTENIINEESDIVLDGFEIASNYHYDEIYVNIATFNFEENALQLVDILSEKHNAKIVKHKNSDGVNKYKVVIGPFKNIDNLLRILNDDTIDKYEDLSIFLI